MVRRLAVAVAVSLIATAPAGAATGTFTCVELQNALNNAGNGDVITLSDDHLCNQSYTLPSFPVPAGAENYKQWTLAGTNGSGFDGTGLAQRVLTGDDVHRLLIQNLTFVDSTATGAGADGGAISITGDSALQVFSSSFFRNSAPDRGGAISFVPDAVPDAGMTGMSINGNTFGSDTDPNQGNGAGTGGAVWVNSPGNGNKSFIDNLFGNNIASNEQAGGGDGGAVAYILTSAGSSDNVSLNDNRFVKNTAAGSGGGASITSPGSLNVSNELYDRNKVGVLDGGGDDPRAHVGGGLSVVSPSVVQQQHNVFTGNTVDAFPNGQDYGGGGESIVGNGFSVNSSFNRWVGNAVAGQPPASGSESTGGALHIQGNNAVFHGLVDDFAANSVGPLGEGGGIYTGAAFGTILELKETTVAGNTVGSGGEFPGIAGDANDGLFLINSIVWNGAGDIGGFGGVNAQFSDACNGGAAYSGNGNICADPLLVNPAAGDIHQTAQSPTIDAGSDDLFNQTGERNPEDYEGDPRPTDGDGDGHTVDMGADESPAAGPPPPPHVPQCSDGVDNDGDGAIDLADPGCLPGPTDDNEGDESPGDLVLCGSRQISLVRADVKGSKVTLSGFVSAKHAGGKVQLSIRYLGKRGKPTKLGSVTAKSDGSFQGRVAKPSRRLFKLARYRAQIGTAKSVELKLPQSLASTSLKEVAGNRLELRGQVDRRLLGKRNAVVVKRILCGRYTTVGQAKPNRKGRYVVRFPAPTTTTGSALYRAETKVLARPGSKRYVKQFARAIGITF